MDKATRNSIQRATQAARRLLEEAFRKQLEGTYDILLDGTVAEQPGSHLSERQRLTREKLVAAVTHKRSTGLKAKEAVDSYLREAAFTALNRFVALKMLEARNLVQECVSEGEASSGFRSEFTALAPGLVALEDKGYRLYLETLFDEIGQEVRVLFDRRDVSSLLWPDRQTLIELFGLLNAPELAGVWSEDETIGWVYQYFNGDEERAKMRKASQAPRNSRELAVRNQFFTPRYVVQFLTDNTLGRTWYEMMKGETKLASLDYLVRRPNEVFLAEGDTAPKTEVADRDQEKPLLQTAYVPFRAKKDPRDLRILDPACGSGHFLLYAFDLLMTVYEEAWTDARAAAFAETGTRLRTDYASFEDLRRGMPELILRHNLHGVDIDPRAAQIAALAVWMRAQRAYNQFEVDRGQRPPITKTNIVVAEPMPGDAELINEFAASLKPAVLGDLFRKMAGEMKLAGELGSLLKIDEALVEAVEEASEANNQGSLFAEKVESQDFWDTADEMIIAALRSFAESTAGAGGIRRQLFAGDAAQGVAFIELMRKRFDAVLMNPPFGEPAARARSYQKKRYADSADNLAVAFLIRAHSLREPGGSAAAITDCSWSTKFDYRFFREWLIREESLAALVDLGWNVLDANVETNLSIISENKGVLGAARLTEHDARSYELTQIAAAFAGSVYRLSDFASMPNSSFAYELPLNEYRVYERKHYVTKSCFTAHAGVKSCNSSADFRLWWEVPEGDLTGGGDWQFMHNGSPYCPFYYPCFFVVRSDSGAFRSLLGRGGALPGKRYYSTAGAAYGKRTDTMYAYYKPADELFSQEGQALFPLGKNDPWEVLALANSAVFARHANYVAGQHKYHRYINLVALSRTATSAASEAAKSAYELLEELDRSNENSRFFQGLMAQEFDVKSTVGQRAAAAADRIQAVHKQRWIIDQELGASSADRAERSSVDYYQAFFRQSFDEALVKEVLVSWAVGGVFGRWKVAPDATTSETGLAVDDPGHRHDLASMSEKVIDDYSEQHFFPNGSLRAFLSSDFFLGHARRYSRSRRKAPIYWQLATPSGSYSVWCYYHRLTRDTFFRVANDYVTPKVDHEERKLNTLRRDAGPDPSSKQRKEIEVQETLVAELRAFLAEVKRVAPIWNPNLNDGVIINFAPLWRLVPQHKTWQKECKKAWDKLVKGDYDWAHLAMHLWPERVVPKCRDDRSLAIAHGLEDTFWVEDARGKWKKHQVSDKRCAELVAERSSPAVVAARDELLSASVPVGARKRRKKAKSARG